MNLSRLFHRPDADQTDEVNRLLRRIAHMANDRDTLRADNDRLANRIVTAETTAQHERKLRESMETELRMVRRDAREAEQARTAVVAGVTEAQDLHARLARAEANNLTYEDRLAAYERRPSPVNCPRACCALHLTGAHS